MEREAAPEVAEGDARAGAISVLVMWRRGGVLQSDDLGLLSRLMARVWRVGQGLLLLKPPGLTCTFQLVLQFCFCFSHTIE